MLKRALSHRPAASRIRTRATVVAAGLGVATALGVGVASAADGATAHHAPAAHTASAHLQVTGHGQSAAGHFGDTHDGAHAAAHKATDKDADNKKAAHKKAAHKKAHQQTKSWVKPVHKYKLTASFDQAGGMWSHKHSGQDFAVPIGTPVQAAHSGVVVKAGPNGGGDGPAYGNAIVISNGHGTYSQYAHLSRIDVHVGETVKAGEHIALSGNTGNTTGPHLHFEIRSTPNYGSAVNPVHFLDRHGLHV
ncbi:M23 family metallopeptidase [Streptomyces odontomachi]|uniref:M23 family metallopeptidase n=1 Tax=Streptomyces odontomachi TaxID=2944940 RepID=UPI002109AABD|nr:M23 family metallopeptidase [Streptomyces sp. ODS25]